MRSRFGGLLSNGGSAGVWALVGFIAFNISAKMSFNHKDERIKKLWDKGVRDLTRLARKIGYTGEATRSGIERVQDAIKRLNLKE